MPPRSPRVPEVVLRAPGGGPVDVASVVLLTRSGADGPTWRRGAAAVLTGSGLAPALLDELEVHLARAGATGAVGEVVAVPVVVAGRPVERVLLVGAGGGTPDDLRRAGAAVVGAARRGDVLVSGLDAVGAAGVRAFTEGVGLGRWSPRAATGGGRTVTLLARPGRAAAVDQGRVVARAVVLARDLANAPSSTKSPEWMVRQARRVARGAGLRIRVRDERALVREGFGGLVAVGQGSVRPPRLVELEYRPAGRAARPVPHVALVGKGITFDSGGLSIKPAASMPLMKTDMSGAAAVLAVLGALAALAVPVRVTGLLCLAENMPSGSATRPSDVISQYGGTTVEVLNTDAEGRLVLADALAYAVRRLRPDAVLDIATLTGAVTVALGRRDAALYASDDRLAARLQAAAAASGERVWRMPLVADYRPVLDSDVADLANIARRGGPGAQAGSIVAALFLREFTGDVPWAHLDIAGTGRAEADDLEVNKGGTGWGVRLLLAWLGSGRVR